MTDDYLTTVLEEAEHVAEQLYQVARTTDNQAHEYLRYAILRILEGQADHLPTGWTPIDGVTVGYGSDDAMFDSWGASEDWWETVAPQEACTRFRVFFPDDHQTVPRDIVDVMAALGAWRVWTGSAAACGSYDHRERREVHYLWGRRPSGGGSAPRAAQWPCGSRRSGRGPNGRRSRPAGRRG
jgi:hypothetical protein